MTLLAPAPATHADPRWAIVLAGHQRGRIVASAWGPERPRPIAERRQPRGDLLTETLARVTGFVPAGRVIVVTTNARASQLISVSEAAGARLFLEPADRGSATRILLPTLWIACHEPEATVVVVRVGPLLRNAWLLGPLGHVAVLVEQHPLWVVLLGVSPTGAGTEYGWIEPGERLARAGPLPVFAVRQFLEKPRPDIARACLADRWLWNTFVLVAKASVLAEAARRACPCLDTHWRSIIHQAVVEGRPALLDNGYASAPTVDFSRSVLEVFPSGLTVAPVLEGSRKGLPDPVVAPRRSRIASSWLFRPGYAM